jgi:hypothetical protein
MTTPQTLEQVFEKQVVAISVLLSTTIEVMQELRNRESARSKLAEDILVVHGKQLPDQKRDQAQDQ